MDLENKYIKKKKKIAKGCVTRDVSQEDVYL
jgi:hypothetical protein